MSSNMENYEKLEARFRQVNRLTDVASIVGWDEAVIMPEGASPYRNQAMAELGVVIQGLVSDPLVGQWLEGVEEKEMNEWQQANVREMRRMFAENTAIPPELNQRFTIAKMNCEQKWRALRAANDWASFEPHLKEVLTLAKEITTILAADRKMNLYDAALDMYSPGLNTVAVESLFTELKSFLPDMIQDVVARQKSEKCVLPEGSFPMAAQKALGLELMEAIGFSFKNGRLDESHHPFCGGNARDVRITTRTTKMSLSLPLWGYCTKRGMLCTNKICPNKGSTNLLVGLVGCRFTNHKVC